MKNFAKENINFDKNGIFIYGKFDYEKAVLTALACKFFTTDNDEDEFVCDDKISCYNCLFRRWNQHSFYCLKI
ncbi:MAG: molybdopterin biosynthesis protein MoeB [Campylobacter sp.]|nr:molybdopterin biosynthesis protein MoeB [Campylobacter sp.]